MTLLETKYTAESGHFYKRDGTPAYRIIGANGNERDTTLRDARKLDLVPSVTTILNEAAKPALNVWMQKQVLLAALTLPRQDGEGDDAYCARIMEDSKAQGRDAADEGTRIHAAVQLAYEDKEFDHKYLEHVKGFAKAIDGHFGKTVWYCEQSFAHIAGFGGKSDLNKTPYHADSRGIVLDVKSKDFSEMPTPANKIKLWWDENLVQLAAYREGLGMPNATCANVYVSRTVPGLTYIHVWEEEDLQRGWVMFRHLLSYWKSKNRIETGWHPDAP